MLIPPVRNYYEQQQIKSDEKLINSLFDNCEKYITKNQQKSQSVANLIDVQIIVKNLLEKENPTEKDIKEAKDKIKDIYQADQHYLKNKSFKDTIEWVNHDESSKPLQMNLNKYIENQAQKLGRKDLAKQIVKTFKEKDIATQVNIEKHKSEERVRPRAKTMDVPRAKDHDLSFNLRKIINHHPLKAIHHPIKDHVKIKQKCWVSEIHGRHNVGRISRA